MTNSRSVRLIISKHHTCAGLFLSVSYHALPLVGTKSDRYFPQRGKMQPRNDPAKTRTSLTLEINNHGHL